VLTRKHKKAEFQQKFGNFTPFIPIHFQCDCGKEYKERTGLYKHRKICNYQNKKENINIHLTETNIINDESYTTDSESIISNDKLIDDYSDLNELKIMFLEVLKQNQEIKQELKEIHTERVTTNNICNIQNKTTNNFNLNIFLNETCKDALNIMDFVNSLQLQLKDLETTGNLGYVEGITKIFIKGLQTLDVCKRPIHCSDLKRETLYIRDQNAWEKDENKIKIKKVIKHITNKNIQNICDWTKENPDYSNFDSKQNDKYLKIVSSSMGGINEKETEENLNKIIKNVSKEVFITK
jgi:hypothetical protein